MPALIRRIQIMRKQEVPKTKVVSNLSNLILVKRESPRPNLRGLIQLMYFSKKSSQRIPQSWKMLCLGRCFCVLYIRFTLREVRLRILQRTQWLR